MAREELVSAQQNNGPFSLKSVIAPPGLLSHPLGVIAGGSPAITMLSQGFPRDNIVIAGVLGAITPRGAITGGGITDFALFETRKAPQALNPAENLLRHAEGARPP